MRQAGDGGNGVKKPYLMKATDALGQSQSEREGLTTVFGEFDERSGPSSSCDGDGGEPRPTTDCP